jgi:hypothetical protein
MAPSFFVRDFRIFTFSFFSCEMSNILLFLVKFRNNTKVHVICPLHRNHLLNSSLHAAPFSDHR